MAEVAAKGEAMAGKDSRHAEKSKSLLIVYIILKYFEGWWLCLSLYYHKWFRSVSVVFLLLKF